MTVGSGPRSATLKNTCDTKILVAWCHNSNQRSSQRSRCGRNGRHYQQHAVLRPGERKANQYTLPKGARISYGACYGSYSSMKITRRSYRCM